MQSPQTEHAALAAAVPHEWGKGGSRSMIVRPKNCASCGKGVYPLERVQACEKDWHKQCFRCKHCNMVLSLNAFATINNDPYCKPHYMELFKSKGNYAVFGDSDAKGGTGYTGGFFTSIGPKDDKEEKKEKQEEKKEDEEEKKDEEKKKDEEEEKEEEKKDEEKKKNEEEEEEKSTSSDDHDAASPAQGTSVARGPLPTPPAKSNVTATSAPSSPSPVHPSPAASASAASSVPSSPSPLNRSTEHEGFQPTKPTKCVACAKSVYPLEMIIACEKEWHKQCFRCKHCNSVLSLGGFATINSDPYCKPHYMELFKSKGNYAVFGDSDAKGGTGYNGGFFTSISPSTQSQQGHSSKPKETSSTPGATEGEAQKQEEAQKSATEKALAEEELKKKAAAEEELKKKAAEEELKKKAAEEELKKKAAEEELKKKAAAEEELKKKAAAEEELKKKAAAEEELKKKAAAEEELKKKAAAEEELKKKAAAEEELKKKAAADEELKKKLDEEEKQRKIAEEQLKKQQKDEELRKAAEKEAQKEEQKEEENKKLNATPPTTDVPKSPSTGHSMIVRPNKCAACDKGVYPLERVQACDKDWHKQCFRCKHCNMVLSLKAFAVINAEPYCKPHYMEIFKSKGNYAAFGDSDAKGGTGYTGMGFIGVSSDAQKKAKEEEEKRKAAAAASTFPTIAVSPSPLSRSAPSSPAPVVADKVAPSPLASSTRAAVKDDLASVTPKPKPTPGWGESKSMIVRPPKCAACDKGVYPLERVQACDKDWHKQCFRCKHCNMVLSLKAFAVINAEPYCKPHYMEIFKSKGNYAAFGDSDAKGGTGYTGLGFTGVNMVISSSKTDKS